MAKPNVDIYGNISQNNTARTGPSDSNYQKLTHGAGNNFDRLMFTGAGVIDGDPLGTYHTPEIDPADPYTFPKAFIARYSQSSPDDLMLLLPLLGGDYRYPFNIYFDGPTVTIPTLEAYDDENATTWVKQGLGGDDTNPDPSKSYLKGITTTNGAPPASWNGSPLAGDTAPNILSLDTAPLGAAEDLYCNLKVEVPAGVEEVSREGYLIVRYEWT